MVSRLTAAGVFLLFTLVVSVQPASSSVVLYDSLGTWQSSANQTGATVDFTSFAPTPGVPSGERLSLQVPGAEISSPASKVDVVNGATAPPWYNWGDGGAVVMSLNHAGGGMRVDFTSALTATAVDAMVMSYDGVAFLPSQITLQIGNGAVVLWEGVLNTPAKPDARFVGVASTDSFNWLALTPVFNPGGNYALIDNLRLGDALATTPPGPDPQPTPEPWVFFTVGSGLVALRFRRFWAARKA